MNRKLGWLLLAALVAHGLGLGNGFVYDDHRFVESNPGLVGLEPATALLDASTHTADGDRDVYRPLRALGHAFDARRWGLDPFGFHLHSILLHLATVALAWRLLRSLLGEDVALLGAGMLAVHPAGVEVVGWISSRGDQYALLFALLALDLAWTTAGHLPPALRLLGAGVAAALATLGKESAAVLPGIALLAWVLLPVERRRFGPVLALALGVVAAGVLRQIALAGASPIQTPPHGGGALSQVGWSLYGLERLAEHLVLPWRLSIDPPQDAWLQGSAIALRPRTWLGGALLLSPAFMIRRHRRAAFLSGWALLAWLPSGSLLVTLRTLVTDRAAYPMLAPLGGLLALAAARRPRLVVLLAAVLLPLLAWCSLMRTLDFRSDETLWRSVLVHNPGSVRARLGLASTTQDARLRGEWLHDAVRVAPPGSKQHGVALARLGDHLLASEDDPTAASEVLAAALGELQHWAALEGRAGVDLPATVGSLAEALVRMGRLAEAEAVLLSAANVSERPATLLLRWALVLRARAEQLDDASLRTQAEAALSEAARLAPDDPLVKQVIANWPR